MSGDCADTLIERLERSALEAQWSATLVCRRFMFCLPVCLVSAVSLPLASSMQLHAALGSEIARAVIEPECVERLAHQLPAAAERHVGTLDARGVRGSSPFGQSPPSFPPC